MADTGDCFRWRYPGRSAWLTLIAIQAACLGISLWFHFWFLLVISLPFLVWDLWFCAEHIDGKSL